MIRTRDLSPAMTVADVGAGTAYFATRLARAVAPGTVVATDIEHDMIRYLDERARREHIANLRTLLATTMGTGLASQSVDRVLVVPVDDTDREALEQRGASA